MRDEEEFEQNQRAGVDMPPLPDLSDAPVIRPNLPKREKSTAPDESPADYRRMGIAYMIPMSLVAPILVFTLAGAWIDRYYKTSYGTVTGAMIGIIAGFVNMFRLVNKLNR